MPRIISSVSPRTTTPLRRELQREGFLEVNPRSTSPSFQKYVDAAIAELRKSKTHVAKATLAMIESGRVRIDTIDDLDRHDYLKARRDLLQDKIALPAHADLHDHHSRAFRAIQRDLDGYMWDDRVYVAVGLSPRMLAATLVHEVNHVLNESEEHYRGDAAVMREEVRAFYAEAWFEKGRKPTRDEVKRIQRRVANDYGLANVVVDGIAPGGAFELD